MSTQQFEELLQIIAPMIQKSFNIREPIHPEQRLCLTLRFLASGDSMTSLSYQYLIGLTTVSNIIVETCEIIWHIVQPLVLTPLTEEKWREVANTFNEKWQFPHCLGALDGKHVMIQCPNNAGSTFYNYKGFHSIVLMALCDANYVFTLVDIGAPGRNSDGGIFRRSIIRQNFDRKQMNVPVSEPIYEGGPTLPYVIVADEAFPLTQYLLRPFPGKNGLSPEKRIFNYRLSRARRTIENAFGLLSTQWRIFRKSIIANVENIGKMVQATVCLHNWLRKQDANEEIYITSDMVDEDQPNGTVRSGSWRTIVDENNAFRDLTNCSINTYSRQAAAQRNDFMEYFNEEGAVPWQFLQVHMLIRFIQLSKE